MNAALLRSALLLALLAPGSALAARSDWSPAEQSQMRLLLSPAGEQTVRGGIEIALEPGWYTYWRNPGEAGIPPRFDFSGSENVADVEVLYPAPERYDDGTSVSLIYRDSVVFPIVVTPVEPDRPVTVQLTVRFGVCREVCIPTGTEAAVTLGRPAAADPLADATLERSLPRLPGEPEPGRFEVADVTVDGATLVIDVRTPDSSYLDLFAEPPPGWFVGQPAPVSRAGNIARYRLSLAGRPDGSSIAGQSFRFLAVAGGEAIEEVVEIR